MMKKERKRVLKSFEVYIYIYIYMFVFNMGGGFGWVAPSVAHRAFHSPLLKGSTHPVSGIVVSSVIGCNLNKICVSSGDHCYLLHKKIKDYCENLKNDINGPYPKAFWEEKKSHFYDSLIVCKLVVCAKVIQHQEWLTWANRCAGHNAVIHHGYPGRWIKVQLFSEVLYILFTFYSYCLSNVPFPCLSTNKQKNN